MAGRAQIQAMLHVGFETRVGSPILAGQVRSVDRLTRFGFSVVAGRSSDGERGGPASGS